MPLCRGVRVGTGRNFAPRTAQGRSNGPRSRRVPPSRCRMRSRSQAPERVHHGPGFQRLGIAYPFPAVAEHPGPDHVLGVDDGVEQESPFLTDVSAEKPRLSCKSPGASPGPRRAVLDVPRGQTLEERVAIDQVRVQIDDRTFLLRRRRLWNPRRSPAAVSSAEEPLEADPCNITHCPRSAETQTPNRPQKKQIATRRVEIFTCLSHGTSVTAPARHGRTRRLPLYARAREGGQVDHSGEVIE